ncbi:MAG TPA: hypothetical protein PKH77_21650 [Anaerolineae bacterium]|nr:hypothetical protein [Anaerolineae bacterium]
MNIVITSTLFGIACLVVGKDKLNRGRGGKMTEDGFWLTGIGILAIGFTVTQVVKSTVIWVKQLFTAFIGFVNALWEVIPPHYVILLVIGILSLTIGLIGIAPYVKARIMDRLLDD